MNEKAAKLIKLVVEMTDDQAAEFLRMVEDILRDGAGTDTSAINLPKSEK